MSTSNDSTSSTSAGNLRSSTPAAQRGATSDPISSATARTVAARACTSSARRGRCPNGSPCSRWWSWCTTSGTVAGGWSRSRRARTASAHRPWSRSRTGRTSSVTPNRRAPELEGGLRIRGVGPVAPGGVDALGDPGGADGAALAQRVEQEPRGGRGHGVGGLEEADVRRRCRRQPGPPSVRERLADRQRTWRQRLPPGAPRRDQHLGPDPVLGVHRGQGLGEVPDLDLRHGHHEGDLRRGPSGERAARPTGDAPRQAAQLTQLRSAPSPSGSPRRPGWPRGAHRRPWR